MRFGLHVKTYLFAVYLTFIRPETKICFVIKLGKGHMLIRRPVSLYVKSIKVTRKSLHCYDIVVIVKRFWETRDEQKS